MGVVDEFVRQEGVQQRLDRRIGRVGIEQIGALQRHHVLVGQLVAACAHFSSGASFTAGRPAGSMVPMSQPLPLTQRTSQLVAEEVRHTRLDRGVAAAMQHQPRVAAEQPRRVDAQREIAADALGGVMRDHRFGIAVAPEVFHETRPFSTLSSVIASASKQSKRRVVCAPVAWIASLRSQCRTAA